MGQIPQTSNVLNYLEIQCEGVFFPYCIMPKTVRMGLNNYCNHFIMHMNVFIIGINRYFLICVLRKKDNLFHFSGKRPGMCLLGI